VFSNHLSFETIADLVEGRLSGEANGKAQNHFNECADCASIFFLLRDVIGVMRSDKMEDAPSYALQNAFRIMPRKVLEEKPSLVQKIFAVLSFDSAVSTPAYGVRSGASATRQMIFNVGESDVDLRVTKIENAWTVSGQILGDITKATIIIERQNVKLETKLNESGEFKFENLEQGNYTMRLLLDESEIEIPNIDIQ